MSLNDQSSRNNFGQYIYQKINDRVAPILKEYEDMANQYDFLFKSHLQEIGKLCCRGVVIITNPNEFAIQHSLYHTNYPMKWFDYKSNSNSYKHGEMETTESFIFTSM